MGLGGPVWHASAAPFSAPVGEAYLRKCAFDALQGVGDASRGEWCEWTGRAYHVRRRLSGPEQARVGNVTDIRGTQEVARRLLPVRHLLPAGWTE